MKRIQTEIILKDLQKKIVFIVGPRQVGKTWLAHTISKSFNNPLYLNYDSREDRKIIEGENWLKNVDLLIFDELHKMKQWKSYLKGVFDTKETHQKILVTGSARLDTFRQAGDSLAGRYFAHRLLPFSLSELKNSKFENKIDLLIERGSFPEPLKAEEIVDADRWRMQYIDGLIRTDILDFEKITDFKSIQLVLQLLQERVGSPVSYKSISEDIGISPNTVKKYIQILESLFIVFRITPFSRNIARSLLKEPKIYFYDIGMVKGNIGIKFENLVALSLLKSLLMKTDATGQLHNLMYLKTKEGKEVDFCIVKNDNLEKIIEAKFNDSNFSKQLIYFSKKYNIPGVQVVYSLKREKQLDFVEMRDATAFLNEL